MEHFSNLASMHRYNGLPLPENPLFSIAQCHEVCLFGEREFTTDFYMIGFKKLKAGEIIYGRTKYDHDTGSMSFIKPRQIIQFRHLEHDTDGFMIFIHEDFLHGHDLHSEISKYSYFDYEINEALYLSPREEQIICDLFAKIETEYRDNPDEYSRDIILAYIESMLKYGQRFYKRQFINRVELSGKTLSKFNEELLAYFRDENVNTKGFPTVATLASKLNLSPRYLSDLLKQETGKTAIELIHIHLINEAKNRLKTNDKSVSEIAYELGFENIPYFSKLFKKETGLSPSNFKKTFYN